jgi:hypothetical protein
MSPAPEQGDYAETTYHRSDIRFGDNRQIEIAGGLVELPGIDAAGEIPDSMSYCRREPLAGKGAWPVRHCTRRTGSGLQSSFASFAYRV